MSTVLDFVLIITPLQANFNAKNTLHHKLLMLSYMKHNGWSHEDVNAVPAEKRGWDSNAFLSLRLSDGANLGILQ